MVEFHVLDFPERIEVRLNDAYIDKIRNLTVEKKVRVREKRGNRDYVKTIKAKLIACRDGHPYHRIAERLYPKVEYRYGKHGNWTQHKPFINIRQFLKVHEVTGLPLEEMERNVIEVRTRWAGRVEIPMKFPVVANEDWAWLLGLWYGCGGLITRTRKKLAEEYSVRFSVDEEVFEKKVKPLLKRIAYVPELSEVWYVRKGMRHPLDQNIREGIGNQPKKIFTLVRPIREIMEKFGLPREYIGQKHKKGSKYGTRKLHLKVPDWIKESKKNTHAFIEGYINGGSVGSDFRRTPRGFLRRTAEIRFGGLEKKEVDGFYRLFEEHLSELGITGYPHYPKGAMHLKTSLLYWRGYLIHNNSSLNTLYERFDISRPDLRSRLTLNYFMDPLLYEACRELDSSEILILGALIEKPFTEQELANRFRTRVKAVEKIIVKLLDLGLIFLDEGVFCFEPEPFRQRRGIEHDLYGKFREPTPEEMLFLKNSREVKRNGI